MYTPTFTSLPQAGKPYKIKDLRLAAALLTVKLPLLEMDVQFEGTNPMAIGYFKFEPSQNLIEAVNMYINKEMRLEPIEYYTNISNLKSQIMAAARSPMASKN